MAQYANAVSTTLSSSMTNVATTMTVTSATGFPAMFPFDVHIEMEGANTDEILRVLSLSSGTTYNVARASEPYAGAQTASAHAGGANVRLVITTARLATHDALTAVSGASLFR